MSKRESLKTIRAEAERCRACPLWRNATQTVFGEGPARASVMLVGEQPGEKEDVAGKPFVGPAGKLLDKALNEAGIRRGKIYITNAVKHFKFTQRGKLRLNKTPNASEIKTCRKWFERERDSIKPALIVALGATAAYSVLEKATPVKKTRGKFLETEDGWKILVTVHPSFLLRVRGKDRIREYEYFVRDLRKIAKFV